MVDIDTSYLIFPVLSALLFWWFETRVAILVTFFGGWLVLPVGHYPPPFQASDGFPWWITGLALPADMLVSKAWIVPTVALSGALLSDTSALRRFSLSWWDAPMALWCLWPLISGSFTDAVSPPAAIAAAYLTGCWGLPWVLGRVWFSSPEGRVLFLKGCAWAGVACLPFAVLEGTGTLRFYDRLYGTHPFHADGWARYVGFRPIGLFEHGNQYGIWVAVSALAATWAAITTRKRVNGIGFLPVALLTLALTLSAQSIGALLLLILGLLILLCWRLALTGPLLAVCMGTLALLAALHLSGIVPIERIARDTAIGQFILETFRSLGRGSFLWRISKDLQSLEIIQTAFVTGTSIWDWWRPSSSRPWGLWLLLIGQFGIIGFLLSYGSLLALVGRSLRRFRAAQVWVVSSAPLPLALIVLFALIDSVLNAFLFFPALIAAGAIAQNAPDKSPSPWTERSKVA